MRKVLLLVVAVTVLGMGTAWGDTVVDPSVLQICQTPGNGACPGNDPNLIGTNNIVLNFNSEGNVSALTNPVLLIIGIPNNATPPPSGITFSGGTGQLGGALAFGGTWGTSGGFASTFNSTTGANGVDVYSLIGLGGANNSNNWTNWSGAPGEAGVTGFGLYVYTLNFNSPFGPGDSVTLTFSSDLAAGTMVVAYGCSVLSSDGTCAKEPHNPYATPFTQAGDVVPEPGSLALFGTGLLAMAGFLRRKLSA